MKDSKLIKILKTFSKAEWNEFEKFVDSPYFNNGRKYIPYLKLLKKFYPTFDSERLTREYLYKALYPGKEYKDAVIFTVTSGLYSLAEEFLVQKKSEENRFNRKMELLSQLSARNIDAIHDKHFAEIENMLHSQKAGRDIFKLLAELQTHKVRHSLKGNYEKTLKENIPLRSDYHIYNFMFLLLNEVRDRVVLKDNYNIISPKDLPDRIYNSLDINELLEYTELHYPRLSPVLSTVVNCFITSITTDDSYFKTKEILMKNYSLLDNDLLREMLLIMEGAVSIRLNSGRREYIKEWHLLHRFSVEKGLHIHETNRYVHTLVAHNMINMAFWNREYGWLEYFINNHSSEFSEEYRSYLVSLGNVYLHVSRKEFGQALRLISTLDDMMITFKKRVRILQMIIYYELDDRELTESGLDSFKHYVDNNIEKYGQDEKAGLVSFLTVYEKLIKYRQGDTKINLKQLKKRTLNEIPSLGIDWLLEKITELEY